MNISKQSVNLLQITKNEKIIELIGRVCYKSQDKITDDSYEKFLKMIMKNQHESVIEHSLATFSIYTNRAIANELVRHRIASFSMESTRYVNYVKKNGITFIVPKIFDSIIDDANIDNHAVIDEKLLKSYDVWYNLCKNSESAYNDLISLGNTPEHARGVLTLDLACEIVISANFREWRHILKMRKSKKAHPQMIEIMNTIHDILTSNIKVLFDNIEGVDNEQ